MLSTTQAEIAAMEERERDEEAAERRMLDLGTAAEMLFVEGEEQVVALLLDAEGLEYEMSRYAYDEAGVLTEERWVAYLTVPARVSPLFSDEVCEKVRATLSRVNRRDKPYIRDVVVVPAPVEPTWKDQLQASLRDGGASNQARLVPVKDPIVEDALVFRSTAELEVYRAFKRANETLEGHEKLSLIVNTTVLVNGQPREVDVVVLWNRGTAAVEVDGPHHRGRLAAEQSRDRLFMEAGVMFVDRLCVEDTTDSDGLDRFVSSFLARMKK